MRVLYIGGTGEISYECLRRSVEAGHDCTVFNRGRDPESLPAGVARFTGDMASDAEYAQLGREQFDVVCQFRAYTPQEGKRDIAVFSDRCRQFVFVSTATVYQKPPPHWRLTEASPLGNPFWEYARQKAQLERLLLEAHDRKQLAVTIVRPSLTYRRRFPGTFVSGDDWAWRMLQHRPVIVHGDGQALWTLTHARDFATLFVPLLGRPDALGEAYQIMTETAFTWEFLFRATAQALQIEPKFTFVPTQTLVRYNQEWVGPLLGDKSWTSLFDTSKIERISGPVQEPLSISDGFKAILPYFHSRMKTYRPDAAIHNLLDRIAHEQQSLAPS